MKMKTLRGHVDIYDNPEIEKAYNKPCEGPDVKYTPSSMFAAGFLFVPNGRKSTCDRSRTHKTMLEILGNPEITKFIIDTMTAMDGSGLSGKPFFEHVATLAFDCETALNDIIENGPKSNK